MTAASERVMPAIGVGLTPTQRDALLVIQEFLADLGRAPSLRELADELDLASAAGAVRLLAGLAARGRIAVDRCRTPSIAVMVPVPVPDEPEIVGLFDMPGLSDRADLAAGLPPRRGR